MQFYILCPENIVTGGTELAHQLCHEIRENGYDAMMYYTKATGEDEEPQDAETPEKFRKYCDCHAMSFSEADKDGNVVIVPESITDWAFFFRKAKVAIWWMSVDNFKYLGNDKYINSLNQVAKYHLVQSMYAAEYLRKNNIQEDKLFWLSDYIGEIYLRFILQPEYRKDVILFNPKKGFDEVQPLINKCTFAEWKPLINMTEEEMVLNMQTAKLYVDFGKHPGKDRIPREAAACGCCVRTNKKGSAKYKEDVPIDEEYKFDEPLDYKAIENKIHEILGDFSNHFARFNEYRNMISVEKEYFREDTKGFINLFL